MTLMDAPRSASTLTGFESDDVPSSVPKVQVRFERDPRTTTESEASWRVRVSAADLPALRRARWFQPVLISLLPTLDLRSGWNSHGAGPIDVGSVERGVEALISLLHQDVTAPQTFPTASGGVNFEWSTQSFTLELSSDNIDGVVLSYEDATRDWDGRPADAPGFVLEALKSLALG